MKKTTVATIKQPFNPSEEIELIRIQIELMKRGA